MYPLVWVNIYFGHTQELSSLLIFPFVFSNLTSCDKTTFVIVDTLVSHIEFNLCLTGELNYHYIMKFRVATTFTTTP